MKRLSRSLLVYLLTLGCASAVWPQTALVARQQLGPELALELARSAQTACRERDMQVSVAVVDRAGDLQVFLRDQLAGNFTQGIAVAKAVTAAGFRRDTLGLQKEMPSRPELQAIDRRADVLFVGGGIPVEAAGTVVGAIGVSGAPTPEIDHECAAAALEAITEALMF